MVEFDAGMRRRRQGLTFRAIWPPASGPAGRHWGCPCRSPALRPGRLSDGLALRAGPLVADEALHLDHAGHIVQVFDHVFTDALHCAATRAG